MADQSKGAEARSHDDKKGEKRRSTDTSDEAPSTKKVSMSFGPPKPTPLLGQKISFNLASSGDPKPKTIQKTGPLTAPSKVNAAPIKMSLNAPVKSKVKEAPPVVPKAKVFEDSDDSEEEEMPPEAKMRMKNIGRETPTAAGPNSYGKGKMGFTDRQKLIEKQLQEEMDKISGDKTKTKKS